jgi:hypothetical protein
MFDDIIPFSISIAPGSIAGVSLWALALYWLLGGLRDWVMIQLQKWFNFAERSLYTSTKEFERTRIAREAQNAFYASIFSIIPFLLAGILCNFCIDSTLGLSWSISTGILACIAAGIYELGRQQGNNEE